MKKIATVVLALGINAAAGTYAQPAMSENSRPAESFIGVRVLKTKGAGDLEWSVQLPPSCPDCQLVINEFTSTENGKEFYFHLSAPAAVGEISDLHIKVNPSKVRGVLTARAGVTYPHRVSFTKVSDGIVFDIPAPAPVEGTLPRTWDSVAALYTYVDTPGVRLRIEHSDEERRRGRYATGVWPALESQAALNLEFAAREAIKALGLDRVMVDRGLGVIQLMDFDTNYPTLGPSSAHTDHPPHWHMHVYWTRQPEIRVVPHFYIDNRGLLTHNTVSGYPGAVQANGQKLGRFGPGQTHETLTPDAEVAFTHTITPEGYFALGTSAGTCLLSPVAGGFHTGVDLACDNGAGRRRVRAEDALAKGRLRLFIDERLVEEYLYDPDNAELTKSVISHAR